MTVGTTQAPKMAQYDLLERARRIRFYAASLAPDDEVSVRLRDYSEELEARASASMEVAAGNLTTC